MTIYRLLLVQITSINNSTCPLTKEIGGIGLRQTKCVGLHGCQVTQQGQPLLINTSTLKWFEKLKFHCSGTGPSDNLILPSYCFKETCKGPPGLVVPSCWQAVMHDSDSGITLSLAGIGIKKIKIYTHCLKDGKHKKKTRVGMALCPIGPIHFLVNYAYECIPV